MEYEIFKQNKTNYVIIEHKNPSSYPQPNFMGTGKALVAILNEGETLSEFLKKRYPKIKKNAKKRAEQVIKYYNKINKIL